MGRALFFFLLAPIPFLLVNLLSPVAMQNTIQHGSLTQERGSLDTGTRTCTEFLIFYYSSLTWFFFYSRYTSIFYILFGTNRTITWRPIPTTSTCTSRITQAYEKKRKRIIESKLERELNFRTSQTSNSCVFSRRK